MAKQKLDKPIAESEQKFLEKYRDDLFADTLTPSETKLVFKDLAGIEGIDEFLKSIIKNDRVIYFNASKETQDQVKGACLRTIWLLRSIQAIRPSKEKQNPQTK